MEAFVAYVLIGAVAVLLLIIIWLVRRMQGSAIDASLPAILESLKHLAAVESQVNTLANAHSTMIQNLNKLEVSLKGLEARITETTGDVKEALSKDVGDARRVLVELKTRVEDQSKREDDLHAISRRIERVLVGARTRGASGENILADALGEFPPEMIDRNFRVGGRVVEYAIVLPNRKRMPVDSKWGGGEYLDRIEKETDPERLKRLEAELEKDVEKMVREVASYIEPSSTTNIAIAGVPDSVYSHCKKAHIEAYRKGVLLMAYSMVVPYVLALYHLHLQFARSIEFENIEAYITKIERSLDEIDTILENKLARASTMAANTYTECKQIVGSMRAATTFLRELPSEEDKAGLDSAGQA